MNLYLLTQGYNSGYDTYDSCVVAAPNEYEARRICPSHYYTWSYEMESWAFEYGDGSLKRDTPDSWVSDLELIDVQLIGVADPSVKKGVVCASFNAG